MLTKDDLSWEFTDFRGFQIFKADVQYLLFLLEHKILIAEKVSCYKQFQHDFPRAIFPDLCMTEHLKNHRDTSEFALFKVSEFTKSLETDYIVASEYSYDGLGYRSDIAVVVPKNNKRKLVLAVEIGGTEWTKIRECLLSLPSLRKIWHFPGGDHYFIWRRGVNAKLLPQLEEVNKESLGLLEEEKKAEVVRRYGYWY